MQPIRKRLWKGGMILLLLALPLVGLVAAGKPVGRYLEFPPQTRYVEHPGFSWPVFIALGIAILGVVAPFIRHVFRRQDSIPSAAFSAPRFPFPWWGGAGLALTGIAWFLAWTRFDWFAPLQAFTFSPIWLGYILMINALTCRRTGHCMLRDRPAQFLALFGLSAVFWWYFEYLNRFVQNWYYVGIGDLSRLEYFLFATLPFSTVLPAVLGTYEFLRTFPRLGAGLDDFIRIRVSRPRPWGWVALILFGGSLAVIGIWPSWLFPLLWLSPLWMITSLRAIRGQRTLFAPIAEGSWQRICLLALAALICGFFWELWNVNSQAKWVYAVPFVNRFHLFEMPILGYAGYLPFGLECAVVAELFAGWEWKCRFSAVIPNSASTASNFFRNRAQFSSRKNTSSHPLPCTVSDGISPPYRILHGLGISTPCHASLCRVSLEPLRGGRRA